MTRTPDPKLAGFGALVRKDLTEWMRGRRAWVVLAVVTSFMTLTAANGWITNQIAATLPPDAEINVGTLVPLDNLMAAVGAQIFVLATIFAVGSLVVAGRQDGTLAWVASKPVSRTSIWLSTWLSATTMLAVTAVIIPLAATAAVVVILYGLVDPVFVLALGVGMVALVTFFAAVGLAAGTALPGQPAVIAAGFGTFALMPILAGILPFNAGPWLPTSILTWAAELIAGAPVSWVTPVAFLVATSAVAAAAIRRMTRIEL